APPLIHPALYFEGGFASVGVLDTSRRGWLVMASGDEREKHELQQYAHEALRVSPLVYDGLIDRWRTDAVEHFLAAGSVASFGSVLAAAVSTVEDHLDLQRPEDSVIVAVWSVATYFFPLFRAFPRLNVNGERGSGKSKALEVIAAMAFNGLVRISPTPAVLYRLITPLRPTLCLDEVESLATEDHREILAILNAGYKAGGSVDRVTGKEKDRLSTFEVFAPVAM